MIQAVPAKRVRVSAVMFRIVRGPVFLAAVWGDDQEQADQTIAFPLDDGPLGSRFDAGHRTQSRPVRIDPAVRFQWCQPYPTEASNLFEVFQTVVPTIKNHALRLEAAPMRRFQRRPEMGILGQGIPGLVVDPNSPLTQDDHHRSTTTSLD